jgi:hypothetical protein
LKPRRRPARDVEKDHALIDSVIDKPYSFTSSLDNVLSRETDFDAAGSR